MNQDKGQRLKIARKAARLSQKQLGEALGIDQAFLSRIERGTNDGTVNFWRAAAQVLGVSLDYLLLDEPEPANQDDAQPMRMNKMAILADYTLPRGLRDLAIDNALVDALKISDEEWTQLAALRLPSTADKTGYLQLLVTLRGICQSPDRVTEPVAASSKHKR